MERAQKRDAARKARFWFRRSVYPPGEERPRNPNAEIDLPTPPSELDDEVDLLVNPRHKGDCGRCRTHAAFLSPVEQERLTSVEEEYEEMTINEIINGKGEDFPGLLGVVNEYVKTLDVEYVKKLALRRYLNLIKQRADGELYPFKCVTKFMLIFCLQALFLLLPLG